MNVLLEIYQQYFAIRSSSLDLSLSALLSTSEATEPPHVSYRAAGCSAQTLHRYLLRECVCTDAGVHECTNCWMDEGRTGDRGGGDRKGVRREMEKERGREEGGRKNDGETQMNSGMCKDSCFWFVFLGIEKPFRLLPSLPPSPKLHLSLLCPMKTLTLRIKIACPISTK